MLVFTQQFGAEQRERDGKKNNTPQLDMHLVLIIIWVADLKTVKL